MSLGILEDSFVTINDTLDGQPYRKADITLSPTRMEENRTLNECQTRSVENLDWILKTEIPAVYIKAESTALKRPRSILAPSLSGFGYLWFTMQTLFLFLC